MEKDGTKDRLEASAKLGFWDSNFLGGALPQQVIGHLHYVPGRAPEVSGVQLGVSYGSMVIDTNASVL
eukprot:gene4761-34511_t